MKKVTIELPDDCEVKIVKKEKKKEPVIKTYQDLINNNIKLTGYRTNIDNKIVSCTVTASKDYSEDLASSEKVAKSILAMAMISQLMPYYGGIVEDEEWAKDTHKHVIVKINNNISTDWFSRKYHFLAFHTEKQRDDFLNYNKQLVKDYLMIE